MDCSPLGSSVHGILQTRILEWVAISSSWESSRPRDLIHVSCASWVGRIPWRGDRLCTPVFLGFPCGSAGKGSAWNEGALSSIHGFGRFLGEGNGYSLQYSCLENSIDRGACQATVHGISKSQTQLSDLHTPGISCWLFSRSVMSDSL